MIRLINVCLCILVIGAATWTYSVKHEAEARLSDIRALERDIANRKELIDVLDADWAVLSQPARIEGLAKKFADTLQLGVTASHQIVGFDALPGQVERGASQRIEDIIVQEGLDLMPTASTDAQEQ